MKKFHEYEAEWQSKWATHKTYRALKKSDKPKYYCLDMFPYPSGAGLHVGHPRGYVASDILSRYKLMCGFNVLHPMGFDAFGLPAEQYAIDTGQHPRDTTNININRFKEQLSIIGLGYDKDREINTSDPCYYHWTQWIFRKLFDSWYDKNQKKSRPITDLIYHLEENGTYHLEAARSDDSIQVSSEEWARLNEAEKSNLLMNYRLAYRAETSVNWCPALGTVLANDEVKDGVSERGGYPVEKKKMQQWMLRITAYADRLLINLDGLRWPPHLKEMQRNWIGKSTGCDVQFTLQHSGNTAIRIFTSRPETIYGCTFIVLAPEHPLASEICTDQYKSEVSAYISKTALKSERDRMESVSSVSGIFTGAFVINPITDEEIPVWLSDYVLPDYGTGAIMAVPASDERDHRFAMKFNLPIRHVIRESLELETPYSVKSGTLINSDSYNGYSCEEGRTEIIKSITQSGKGNAKTNYRMRDAVFGRQRYWGEPIPIYYDEQNIPRTVREEDLPIVLPDIDKYLPTESGEPPLARASNWTYHGHELEKTTMPGWAGSSWYFLRYMDPKNPATFCKEEQFSYWQSVDCYVGGSEHATGHLLYSRFWTQFLFDRGCINFEEPFQRIVCQGMILGRSAIIYREANTGNIVSADIKDRYDTHLLHVSLDCLASEYAIDVKTLKSWRSEFENATFIMSSDDTLKCDRIVEKMSKSKHNVVTPDEVIERYGADCFRIHEMFLGPIDQPAPWSTETIEGSSKFLKRVTKLFDNVEQLDQNVSTPSTEFNRLLSKTICKVRGDIENMSYNTAIAALMSLVGYMHKHGVYDKSSRITLLKLLHPFAPHLTQELWTNHLGMDGFLTDMEFPDYDSNLIVDDLITYPISINGKVRATLELEADIDTESAKLRALSVQAISDKIGNNPIKRFVFVQNKIINFVI